MPSIAAPTRWKGYVNSRVFCSLPSGPFAQMSFRAERRCRPPSLFTHSHVTNSQQSFWQKEEGHVFDAYGRELAEARAQVLAASATASASKAAPAPIYDDVEYNPSHAAADWAGLVEKRGQKVHFPLTQSSVLVPHSVGGLTDGHNNVSGSSSSSCSRRRGAPASSSRNTTSLVIGGVDAPEPFDWSMSYEAQAKGTHTPQEMMDPLRLRTKKAVSKQQQQQQQQDSERKDVKGESKVVSAIQQEEERGKEGTLVGYRTPPAFRGKASFLVGMGRKLQEEGTLK